MEKKISFDSQGLLLEGLLETNRSERGVIITHPHPLYGGEMHNTVVRTIKDAYSEKGYTTLRFNFRGTGYSQGEHDDGKGEQNDVLAAFSFLEKSGVKEIVLAGYSFGAWVNLRVASASPVVKNLVLISPPVDFIEFESMEDISALKLVVSGSNDSYASYAHIEALMGEWNRDAVLKEVAGADHFYSGRLGHLKEILLAHV